MLASSFSPRAKEEEEEEEEEKEPGDVTPTSEVPSGGDDGGQGWPIGRVAGDRRTGNIPVSPERAASSFEKMGSSTEKTTPGASPRHGKDDSVASAVSSSSGSYSVTAESERRRRIGTNVSAAAAAAPIPAKGEEEEVPASAEMDTPQQRRRDLTLDLLAASPAPSAGEEVTPTSAQPSGPLPPSGAAATESNVVWQRVPLETGDVRKKRQAFEQQIRAQKDELASVSPPSAEANKPKANKPKVNGRNGR
jgi:hypothetical protein